MRTRSPELRTLPPGMAPVEYAGHGRRSFPGQLIAQPGVSPGLPDIADNWAWPLVGRDMPRGASRRRAIPPVVPLALLDRAEAGPRLAAAVADRVRTADIRTVNRELSALRSAAGWWLHRGWVTADPTAGIRHLAGQPALLPALTGDQVSELFGIGASLREQAFWRVLYDTGGHADDILCLDAGQLHPDGHLARTGICWRPGTGQLLSWLLAGRSAGPVFLTDRRAPAGAAVADLCPVTGRARMSYRRAAEIFTSVTRPLDPAGRGWTLQQLSRAGQANS